MISIYSIFVLTVSVMRKRLTWKHKRRASSPLEFLKLEKPHSISLMSTVPSRLLSNKSNIRGARGISDGNFMALSTSSNSDRVALSPLTHLLTTSNIFISVKRNCQRQVLYTNIWFLVKLKS